MPFTRLDDLTKRLGEQDVAGSARSISGIEPPVALLTRGKLRFCLAENRFSATT
jgi:hypothetical protein